MAGDRKSQKNIWFVGSLSQPGQAGWGGPARPGWAGLGFGLGWAWIWAGPGFGLIGPGWALGFVRSGAESSSEGLLLSTPSLKAWIERALMLGNRLTQSGPSSHSCHFPLSLDRCLLFQKALSLRVRAVHKKQHPQGLVGGV